MKVYLNSIEWIDLKETFTNPVLGAKAILQIKPTLILTDQEMYRGFGVRFFCRTARRFL